MPISRQIVASVFVSALVARVLYWAFVAERLLGPWMYFNNDSFSYTGFVNLWEMGLYTFDPTHPDAPFGRVPVYPMYWGLHWLLFGDGAALAVAASQTALDSVTAVLIAMLAKQVTESSRAAIVAGLLYAVYPFALLWVTVTGTEVLTTFLGALILWLIVRFKEPRDLLLIGALVGIATLTREYLGVLGITAALFAMARSNSSSQAIKRGAILALGFALTFSWWPIRNAMHGRVILLRAETSGYHRYSPELVSARSWINTWTNLADPPLDWLSGKTDAFAFPPEAFTDPAQRKQLERLQELTTTCSTGFHNWRTKEVPSWPTNCNDVIDAGFEELAEAQRNERTWAFYTDVPGQNLWKGVFKNDLVSGGSTAIRLGLLGRTLLLLLGFAGAFVLRRRLESATIVVTFALHYLVISGFLRFVEMRYLLWVDALMLVPAAYFLVWLFERARDWRTKSRKESAS